jgi:hypothetical protein
MLSQSRALRLALVLLMSLGYVAWHGHGQNVYARGDDDDDEEEGDEGDEGGGDEGEEEEEEDAKEQPPVTSGGLYTLKTYPIRELSRPLTMTQGIFQGRIGVGVDVSAQSAFESFGLSAEGRYGFRDNVTGLFGLTDAFNFKQFGFYAGVEGAIAYNLIDFRTALRISRPAAAEICVAGGTPACPTDAMGMELPGKPTGKYISGDIHGSIDLGFPFRYVAKPEIAIIALDTLMSIDFDSKPDLNPSLGISTNPIAALSVVIFATLQIVDFNTDAGFFTVPATARVQFSPNHKLDLGLEFTFLNVKPPEGQKFYDSRFLSLFMQFRAGK